MLNPFILITFLQLITLIKSNDYDCIQVSSPSLESCKEVNTGTNNSCCYVTEDSDTRCLLVDGTSPVNILTSLEVVKKSLNASTTNTMECGTKAEVCANIQNPKSFSDCNRTDDNSTFLPYPYTCCYVHNGTKNYCYPINASYLSTVKSYVDNLLNNYYNNSNVPEGTVWADCNNASLPESNSRNLKPFVLEHILILILVFLV